MWTKQGWRYWEKRYEHDLKKEKEEKEGKEEKEEKKEKEEKEKERYDLKASQRWPKPSP